MPDAIATIQFLGDWSEEQSSEIERGGQLAIEYDKTRSPRCFTTWRGAEVGEIVANVRFHPRGELFSGSVLAEVRQGENPPGPVVDHVPKPFSLPVPSDATQVEIWFHNFYQTSSRCDAWDSDYGRNYWFGIGGPPPRHPSQPVPLRDGAIIRPDLVNVLTQSASKINAFPASGQGPRLGTDLQTILHVIAWVRETATESKAWIDVHVFNAEDVLIHNQNVPLRFTGFGSEFRYEFSGKVYQGSTATPGSVQPRPEARKLQYRLYYEIHDKIFTDGILHQHEFQPDAVTH